MKIRKKSKKEIVTLREGGKILAEALYAAAEEAKLGTKKNVSTWKLNEIAEKIIRSHDAVPSFLGYPDENGLKYPASLCVSIDDEIVHGVPKKDRILRDGDLVTLDLGVIYKKLYTDSALTVIVGKGSPIAHKITEVTKRALELGLEQMYSGSTLGNYGNAVDRYVRSKGFVTAKGIGGHGVGYAVHEPPFIPNDGSPGTGLRIEEGMVLALEPLINEKTEMIEQALDGITFKTVDGGLSAQFEHTVAITKDGHKVLTERE
ncbi:MAG: type I methionyl aminopeptidase [Patescibacteria group bacterium]|nr:type I methionyl aminopeptidase [Patescibacteria group bacterium]